MKLTRVQIYLLAWLLYVAFIFAMYPHFKITVMLFSFPLTMLGGFLFLYRGALLTILATVVSHYFLLSFYSDDPRVIHETFNPFGIGSQLIFSFSAALLKSTQIRYKNLNNSLQTIVEERTQDLEQLTSYLIESQQRESKEVNSSLLVKSRNEFDAMLASSRRLKDKMTAENHPRATDADNIHKIIKDCIRQLIMLEDYSSSNLTGTGNLTTSVKNLQKRIRQISEVDIRLVENQEWDRIPADLTAPLSEIIFEAVSNAIHHADPEKIIISIDKNESTTVVYIENDGIPLRRNHLEGMGLPLMRYRARKIGADFSLKTSPNGMTRAECAIPQQSA